MAYEFTFRDINAAYYSARRLRERLVAMGQYNPDQLKVSGRIIKLNGLNPSTLEDIAQKISAKYIVRELSNPA